MHHQRRQDTKKPRHSAAIRVATALLMGLVAGPLLLGCDREDPAPRTSQSRQKERVVVPPPASAPVYTFAPGVCEPHRDICDFVRQFLEICLAGDYTGYRRLVSRSRDPESRERFQAIYHAMQNVRVEGIEPVQLPDVPPPAFRVITSVELDPGAKVALRGTSRRVAILVFREQNEWRMLPAPAGLQPDDEAIEEAAAASTAPSYPWEPDGDY